MRHLARVTHAEAGYADFSALPALPSAVRYVDEYDDGVRTIERPGSSDLWTMRFDTRELSLDMGCIEDGPTRFAVKWFVVWGLKELSPTTVCSLFDGIRRMVRERGSDWLTSTLHTHPAGWASLWEGSLRHELSFAEAYALKSFLHFLCDFRVGPWNPGYSPLLKTLRFERAGKHAGVRSGESFLTASEEAAVVAFLDDIAGAARAGREISPDHLLRHCLLAICYEHGLRPVQIGRIALGDLRVYGAGTDAVTVHFVAHRAKKRDGRDRVAFVRRVRRDWAAPFVAWHALRIAALAGKSPDDSDKAFPDTVRSMIVLIGDVTEQLTGFRRTATDFRHSVAQRLADSGASVEEVAHFLGHSCLATSLIYFEHSAEQADQVNRALATSPVYASLAEVARTGTIDKKRLLGLPPDNQVGALPHGIPVAGIGGCDLGQSLCELNPALSCYTCRKFIPVSDANLHREVLDSFRQVARFFYDESRGDRQSPAFMNLRITLTAIQKVIEDLGPTPGEPT
jgi:integrase